MLNFQQLCNINDGSPDTGRRKRPLSIIEEIADDEAGSGEGLGHRAEHSAAQGVPLKCARNVEKSASDLQATQVRKTRRKAVVNQPLLDNFPQHNGIISSGPMAQWNNSTESVAPGSVGASGDSVNTATAAGLCQTRPCADSPPSRKPATVPGPAVGGGSRGAGSTPPGQSGQRCTHLSDALQVHHSEDPSDVTSDCEPVVTPPTRPRDLQWKPHNSDDSQPGSPASLRHHNFSEMRHVVWDSRGSDAESGTEEDLAKLKTTADKLNLKTRRQSYLTWRAQYVDKPRDLPVVKVVAGGNVRLTKERIERVDSDLKWIRNELIDLKRQDQTLARQLLGIRQKLTKLRLASSCEEHQDLLDDARDQMEELRELSRFADFPPEMFGYSSFKQFGVTKMNLHSRRFSTC